MRLAHETRGQYNAAQMED